MDGQGIQIFSTIEGSRKQCTGAGSFFRLPDSFPLLAIRLPRATNAGLVHLKGLTRLQTLRLYNIQVTDAGLEHLKGLTSLRDLHLLNTQVTDDGVKKIQEALPNCKARLGTVHF